MSLPAHWIKSAAALLQTHQLQALRQFCQQVLAPISQADQPENRAYAHYFLGLSWAESNPELALEAYLRAIEGIPDHPDFLRQTAHLLRRMGKDSEALSYYQQVVHLTPKQVDSRINLLLMLRQTSDWHGLNKALTLALNDFPDNPTLAVLQTKLRISAHQGLAETALQGQDYPSALNHFQSAFLAQRGQPWSPQSTPNSEQPFPPLEKVLPEKISQDKLQHDLEQWHWLAQHQLLPPTAQTLLPDLQKMVVCLPPSGLETRRLPSVQRTLLNTLYNAPIYWPQTDFQGPLLNPQLDFQAIERTFLQAPCPMLWFDDLLSSEALNSLRQFCLGATIWRDYYADQGYLGAFMDDGFVSPLLLNLAKELQLALPQILGDKALHYLWGFKYGQSSQGIRLHADQAKINLNFWLTPDCANLNPGGGGLQVYDRAAPQDWDFKAYNDQSSQSRMMAYLLQTNAQLTHIPHRQNRAVLFHSRLFHRTDPPEFKQGYENRRINVTMLFG